MPSMPWQLEVIVADLFSILECVGIVLSIPCIICATGFREISFWRGRKARPPTPSLPSARIDIRRRRIIDQPQGSHLFSLPLELRRCIYEHALGGRLVKINLAASKYRKHYVVTSTCYQPVGDLDKIPNLRLQPLADEIPVALLLTCRQVYLEALPILHQRNTFYFLAHEFPTVVLAALGQYCLQDLRNVYIRYDFVVATSLTRSKPMHYDSRWATVFSLLQQMRSLECLVLELDASVVVDPAEPQPLDAVLDSPWGRRLLSFRGLRRFTLFFTTGDPSMLPGFNDSLLERMRVLMTETNADDQYASFLAVSRQGGRSEKDSEAVSEAQGR